MVLKNHCLFCLERTVPYTVPSGPTSVNGEDRGRDIIGEETPLDFQSLCTYLRISLPKKEKGYEGAVLSSSCDKFLCISCFEMVDQLSKLHKELTEIQRRIGEATGRIMEVIVAHDIGANLSSSNKRRRVEFQKNVGSRGIRRSQDNRCLSFVEMFQTMIKGLNNDSGGVDNPAMTSPTTTDTKKNWRTKVSNKDPATVSNEQMDDVEIKIELGEEDLNNCEGEGDQDLFPDFQSETVCPSPLRNENEDLQVHRDTSGQLESKEEDKDDVEWKPKVVSQSASKRKFKSRQSSNQTKPAFSKTKKKIRRTSPGPSNKIRSLKEDETLQQFKCTDCDLSFATWRKRWEHRKKSHPPKLSTLKSLAASIPTVPYSRPSGVRNRVRIYICTICGQHVKERSHSKLLNYMEHMLYHDEHATIEETGPHFCTDCDKQFNLKINLDLHVACIHDTRQEVIRCDLCTEDIVYGTGEALIEHLKSAHGDTVHSCKHCPMSYISFEKLLLHMVKHRGCKKLLCPECGAVGTTFKELQEHCYKVHPQLKETFICEICNKFYLAKSPLRLHLQKEHGFDPKSNTFKEGDNLPGISLICPHCKSEKGMGKIFKTELALRLHITSTHKRKKDHKCDQCEDKYFESRSALQKHVEKNHENIRYPCPHCPKSYTESYQLNFHMKTHTGEGLLTCDICSKQFPRMSQLKAHMRTHTTPDPDEKRVCEECGKEFPDQVRLMNHRSNVHPKKKKECPACGLVFNRSDNLKSHMRIHSGERPYQCPACKKCFNRRDILRVHVKGVHGMEVAEAEEKYKQESASADL